MDPFYLDFCNTTKEFKKYLTKYYSPEIRKFGFKGTGLNYNKQLGHYIHSIQIFPDKWGGQCWVEVGAHLDFLPESSHMTILKPSKVKTIDSIIRKTIEDNGKQKIYLYGRNEEEAKHTIEKMLKDIKRIGLSYLDQFTEFPSPFTNLSAKDLENDTYSWLEDIAVNSLNLARINCYLRNEEKTQEFCKYGLKPTTEKGGKMIRALYIRLLNGDKNFCFTENELNEIKKEHENTSRKTPRLRKRKR
jgi:hypothetical protein